MSSIFRIVIVAALFVTSIAVAGSALALKPATVPGWGLGDQNHVHTGPPGQSVRPGDISQTNNNNVSNNFTVSANTGNNAPNTTSGDANVGISVVNYLSQNIFGN